MRFKNLVKLPFTAAWDCLTLGNMGDGSSTVDVIRQDNAEAELEATLDALKKIAEIKRINRS